MPIERSKQRLNWGSALPVFIGGAELLADSSGVAVWPAHATLLVSDLHLEKGTASAGRGVFLPPYDTRETLNRLADAIARYEPRRVIALGDSFHVRMPPTVSMQTGSRRSRRCKAVANGYGLRATTIPRFLSAWVVTSVTN